MCTPFEHNAAYKIVHACDGAAIDVKGCATSNGGHVIVWPWHGNNNQVWIADKESDGYRLTAKHCNTLMALDENCDGSVTIWKFHGGCNQQWNVVPGPCGNDTYFIQNVSSGNCLRKQGSGCQLVCVPKCECDHQQLWKITTV